MIETQDFFEDVKIFFDQFKDIKKRSVESWIKLTALEKKIATEELIDEIAYYETQILNTNPDLYPDKFLRIVKKNLIELEKKIGGYSRGNDLEQKYEGIWSKFCFIERKIFYKHMKFENI